MADHVTDLLYERWCDPARPCYVIAEIGVNHNGSEDLASRLIDVAAEAGADAVKFQTFKADHLTTSTAPKAAYQKRNDPRAESQAQMLRRLEFPDDVWSRLKAHCTHAGIEFLSTPFDEESADLLHSLGVDAIKVSSGDLTHIPLLQHIAAMNLPIILSTGMSDLGEVCEAIAAIEAAGDPPLALLHCVSVYPADPADANLAALETMSREFGRPVGWSDHTSGEAITLAAVALGARIIEKHFTLSKDMEGPDHRASLEPEELRSFIANIRAVESAIGDGIKRPTEAEKETAAMARRSIVAAVEIAQGTLIEGQHLAFRRPSTGIEPRHRNLVAGRTAAQSIAADEPIIWEMLV